MVPIFLALLIVRGLPALLYRRGVVGAADAVALGLLVRGGPARRAAARGDRGDFLFPQELLPEPWAAGFVDYLYLSFTNATSLGPTDTMPLSSRSKLLMLLEALISLLTLVLVAAHAVNALGSETS
jgi:uncharacterized membrane protein